MESLILRTCSACLQELADVKNAIQNVDARVSCLQKQVSNLTSAHARGASSSPSVHEIAVAAAEEAAASSLPPAATAAQGLQELCLVEDDMLRSGFVAACEEGQVRVELRDLVHRVCSSCAEMSSEEGACLGQLTATRVLRDTLPRELRCGHLCATVFRAYPGTSVSIAASSNLADVEAALEEVANGAESGLAVVFTPLFRRICWPLLQAAMFWCRQEGLTPTLGLLHSALRSLVSDDAVFHDIDVLGLLRRAPPGVEALVIVDAGGQVAVGWSQEANLDEVSQAEVEEVTEAIMQCGHVLHALRNATCSSNRHSAGGMQQTEIVDVLPLVRAPQVAQMLHLPEALRAARGGALLRACGPQADAASLPLQPTALGTEPAVPMAARPALARVTAASVARPAAEPAFTQPAVPAADATGEGAPTLYAVACGAAAHVDVAASGNEVVQATWDPLPSGPVLTNMRLVGAFGPSTAAAFDTAVAREDEEIASTAGTGYGEVLTGLQEEAAFGGRPPNILEQQAAFIECFREELFGQRPLLLSQLNNLYKMRSGEELPYKLSGYEKLRDFLLDVPGISLVGRGNRMQVRLEDPSKLEAFKNSWQRARLEASDEVHSPQFRMPQTLPDSLLQQLYELFMSSEGHEIPLRNFLSVWNNRYPTEPLAYRALGFRDVRGLLSQVAFIQKVGGKSDARYVLRHADVPQHLVQARAGCEGGVVQAFVEPAPVDMQRSAGTSMASPAVPMRAFDGNAAAIPQPGPLVEAPTLVRQDRPLQGGVHRYDVHNAPQLAARVPMPLGAPPPAMGGASVAQLHDAWAPEGPPGGPCQSWMPFAATQALEAEMAPHPTHQAPVPEGGGLVFSRALEHHMPGPPVGMRAADASCLWANTGHPSAAAPAPGMLGGIPGDNWATQYRGMSPARDTLAWGLGSGRSWGLGNGCGLGGLNGLGSPPMGLGSGSSARAAMPPGNSPVFMEHRPELVGDPREEAAETLVRAAPPSRQLPRTKKSASFFVSSPGAFSSETRDASIHQGKFDMCSVLQMQLRQDTPCLVCDITGGQVMVTNMECEDFFESSDANGRLVQSDIFTLIHQDDRDKFSQCLAYLMVSERTRMDPQELRVITRTGRMRSVRTEGEQLIGMWWQLDFWLLSNDDAPPG